MGNPHNYSLSLALYKNLPYVELNWYIDGKAAEPPPPPWPGGRLDKLSFSKLKILSLKVGRLGGVIEPAKDLIKGSILIIT